MQNKHTVIVGATTNPERTAFIAAQKISAAGHSFTPIGIKKGTVAGQEILNIRDKPKMDDVDTVTLYLSAKNQTEWEDYILSMNPRRIIFNPGAENPSFASKASDAGVEVHNECTLVLLAIGEF